jgi:MoaE-MoaD fusion protein
MRVQVLYFAHLRERLRTAGEPLDLPPGSTAGDLLDVLGAGREVLRAARGSLRVAVNQEFVALSHVLQDGDEVALIPPVSGGSGDPGGPARAAGAGACRLSREPLSLDEVVAAVSGPSQGGVVTFTGAVRGQSRGKRIVRLEYEAYEPMALRTLSALVRSIEEGTPGARVAVVHRLGTLQVGELAVVIAASAPHRAEAFAACRAAIDRLKEEVPIWKKEVAEDGAEWIGERP